MQTFSIDESTIHVRRGQQFCIVAAAIPTAGYRWAVQCDSPAVVQIESDPVFDRTSGKLGGGAVQRIVLESRESGAVTVRFTYAQVGSTVPEKEAQIEIVASD